MSKKSIGAFCAALALAVVSVICFVSENTVAGILFASSAVAFAIGGLAFIKK